jgi:bleomycin hydrolase
MEKITEELLEKMNKAIRSDRQVRTNTAAMAKTELKDLAFLPVNAAKLNGEFEIEIKTHGITAQQKSGRCWLFAALNIMREEVIKKTGVKEFELSQNYLSFYDKLEKANNILEMAIRDAGLPLSDRKVEYDLLRGMGDGGYFDMAKDLAKKYGVVPKQAMPESYQSEHTDKLRYLTNYLLKKDAGILRSAVKNGEDTRALKEKMLTEIYKIEVMAFGEPVNKFDFSYRDKDGNFHEDKGITPKEFYDKYVGLALDDYVTLINEPTKERKVNTLYKFHYTGSMAESDVYSLNVSQERMEELVVKQLRNGCPVWFGCDAGAFGDRKEGVWDPDSFDYEGLLGGIDLFDTKENHLLYRASSATHAMILTGVNFDKDGRPERYKIENSWGKDVGHDGYFVCSEKYFREFVYEAVIKKEFLSEAEIKAIESDATLLEPWEVY